MVAAQSGALEALLRREELAIKRQEGNVKTVVKHCRASIRVGLKNAKECDLN
jgi:hypothetical protein